VNLYRKLLLLPLLLWLPLAAMADDALYDLEGHSRGLSDYIGRGQWTVVMIWASSCGVCQYEAPHLEAFQQKHKDSDAQVLGVSIDGRDGMADAQQFVDDHELSFPNLVGSPEAVAALYYDLTGNHLLGTPGFLVLDPAGRLRTYESGRIDVALLERFIQRQVATAEVLE
jgi:peroxiredoxin